MKRTDLAPSVGPLPALPPHELAASAAAAVREILAEGASANTTRSYASALRYWAAWFRGRYGVPLTLPVPPLTVNVTGSVALHASFALPAQGFSSSPSA